MEVGGRGREEESRAEGREKREEGGKGESGREVKGRGGGDGGERQVAKWGNW